MGGSASIEDLIMTRHFHGRLAVPAAFSAVTDAAPDAAAIAVDHVADAASANGKVG